MVQLVKYCILFLLALFVLQGCNKVGGGQVSKGQGLASPFNLPAKAYLSLANKQEGNERQALVIMAAGRFIEDGDLAMANALLNNLQDLTPLLTAERYILLAKIKVNIHKYKEAITILAKVHDLQDLSLFYQVQYHEILAFSYDKTGNFPEAIGERIILDKLLPTENERIRNRRILWLSLTRLPDAELNTLIAERTDLPELLGWLKLAEIAKTKGVKRNALLDKVYAWQEEFPNHPAKSMLHNEVISGSQDLYKKVKQIALLLPMTGPLAGPGNAVYDGFMAKINKDEYQVMVYDTAKYKAAGLYDKAVTDGADFVIGPLAKPEVLAVMALLHPVPTLLLNETPSKRDKETFFLTLSPINEARLVANAARQEGYQHALIIAPNNNWGEEVMLAFQKQWQARGGQIVDILRYSPNTFLKSSVREFLHYSEDDGQHSQREDFDMVFLLAYPSKARTIMPLLKYYGLGKAKVFATSSVYAGSIDANQDRDLDGLIFCDMPYVFTHNLPNKHWPEQLNSYSRLYALGLDSATLVEDMNKLLLFPAMGVDNEGGLLYLTHDNQVVRMLTFGTFIHGKAEAIK